MIRTSVFQILILQPIYTSPSPPYQPSISVSESSSSERYLGQGRWFKGLEHKLCMWEPGFYLIQQHMVPKHCQVWPRKKN